MIQGLQMAGQNPTRKAFIDGLHTVTNYDANGLLTRRTSPWSLFGQAPQTDIVYFVQLQGSKFVPVPANGKPSCGDPRPELEPAVRSWTAPPDVRLRHPALQSPGNFPGAAGPRKGRDRGRIMTHQPMTGIKMVKVAQFTFTPAAGAVLADWGADVIKIEHAVTGDAQRGLAGRRRRGDRVVPTIDGAPQPRQAEHRIGTGNPGWARDPDGPGARTPTCS